MIALVTGASKGIGKAIALELADMGYDIWLNYRSSDESAAETAALIRKKGSEVTLLKFDVADKALVNGALNGLVEEFGPPDILVNNAGIARDGLMMWMPSDDWTDVTDTTLNGFFNVTKAVLQSMLQRKSGKIINIASVSGVMGNPGQVNYSAAKGGLIAATKALAKETAKRGICVNCIAPGFIETDMVKELPVKEIVKMIPMQKIGQPEDVAGLVGFLVSDRASYITGQVIGVNGGVC
ncbi:MAG: 3-oxoacyl-ACP reductase FabG [Desulfobacterales bacterium]|nr:3-oxoacyl-ACP reductase FabG [Desulfobacterales bacterium]